MNKKILLLIIIGIIILAAILVAFRLPKKEEQKIILFYGEGCPACQVVEDFIKENNIGEKVDFAQKEVYHNKNNAKELTEKAKICGLPTQEIGIPFLWDGENSKCLIGVQDIKNFFEQKINQ